MSSTEQPVPQSRSSQPKGGGRRGKDRQLPTYPHDELGVAPDHRCLAELERETKATVEQVGDTSLSLSLHDIPLSPRRRVWGRKQW